MDSELDNKVRTTIEKLNSLLKTDNDFQRIDYERMDPVAKLMFVALVDEMRTIEDNINHFENRVFERYTANFIPRQSIEATPAIALVRPQFRPNKDTESVEIGAGVSFTYKLEGRAKPLNYIPLFKSTVFPYSETIYPRKKAAKDWSEYVKNNEKHSNKLWVGISTNAEINSLHGLTMLIKGTQGVRPKHIYVGSNPNELDFATISEMENIDMLSPFHAQQSSSFTLFSFIENWRESMLKNDDAVWLFVTDDKGNRDNLKKGDVPRSLLQWIESNTLKEFDPNTLWLQFDFPEGFVVPGNCEIQLNVIPVVNIVEHEITLTQSFPIAKLQGDDDSFFLGVLQPSKDFLIRDFDASCYNSGDLYRDVRNLLHRFNDDYYAFVEYNEIRDGVKLKKLRDIINEIGNTSAQKPNKKYLFDSGTYAMRNINLASSTSSVLVNYIVTQGAKGNDPKADDPKNKKNKMENKKIPLLKQEVEVVVSATGGTDKASVDRHHDLLRYYALTNDRLYTKMDIDAFLKKEIADEFGEIESKRISFEISIHGAGGTSRLQRGLYIDISFKDRKNYDKAQKVAFDKVIQQRIENKSCIAMPIIITLINKD